MAAYRPVGRNVGRQFAITKRFAPIELIFNKLDCRNWIEALVGRPTPVTKRRGEFLTRLISNPILLCRERGVFTCLYVLPDFFVRARRKLRPKFSKNFQVFQCSLFSIKLIKSNQIRIRQLLNFCTLASTFWLRLAVPFFNFKILYFNITVLLHCRLYYNAIVLQKKYLFFKDLLYPLVPHSLILPYHRHYNCPKISESYLHSRPLTFNDSRRGSSALSRS